MSNQPKGNKRKITDQELRADIGVGLTNADIARKWGVTPAAISQRVKNLSAGTVAAAVAPVESQRFVGRSIDAMEELSHSLENVRKLMDACDEWLQDADDPGKYDVGPRTSDVYVTYYELDIEGRRKKVKKALSELIDIVEKKFEFEATEYKVADPRELILKTAQETRATVTTVAELLDKIFNIRAVEAFRSAMLTEISKVDPSVAQRIAEAVQRSVVLYNSLGGLTES
jgi:DNA-binding Lrp family transcriptional regulator